MRDEFRIVRILSLIEDIWSYQPDTRFNQLISNLATSYSNKNNGAFKVITYDMQPLGHGFTYIKEEHVDLFHLEDDEYEKFLEEYLEGLKGEYRNK